MRAVWERVCVFISDARCVCGYAVFIFRRVFIYTLRSEPLTTFQTLRATPWKRYGENQLHVDARFNDVL